MPFYEAYIPLCCEGDPAKLKAAMKALADRNLFEVEDIINPLDRGSRMGWIRREQAKANELTEEEDEAILRALGYDIDG